MTKRFLPPHGGYKKLLSYRKVEIIYDATVYFTSRFFHKGDRTIDQRNNKDLKFLGPLGHFGPFY